MALFPVPLIFVFVPEILLAVTPALYSYCSVLACDLMSNPLPEFKATIRDALDKSGAMARIRAAMRAELFRAIDDRKGLMPPPIAEETVRHSPFFHVPHIPLHDHSSSSSSPTINDLAVRHARINS